VLGFGDVEIKRLLDYLYPALANEIQQPTNTHARKPKCGYSESIFSIHKLVKSKPPTIVQVKMEDIDWKKICLLRDENNSKEK